MSVTRSPCYMEHLGWFFKFALAFVRVTCRRHILKQGHVPLGPSVSLLLLVSVLLQMSGVSGEPLVPAVCSGETNGLERCTEFPLTSQAAVRMDDLRKLMFFCL